MTNLRAGRQQCRFSKHTRGQITYYQI